MAFRHWSTNVVHRIRISVGERLLRIVQLKTPRRVPEWEIFYSIRELRVLDRVLAKDRGNVGIVCHKTGNVTPAFTEPHL